jgi:hypothetical protein
MTEIDPTRDVPQRSPTGDDEVDQMLAAIERASEQSLDQNARVLDGHLRASDNLIANLAALRTIGGTDTLVAAALEAAKNPT